MKKILIIICLLYFNLGCSSNFEDGLDAAAKGEYKKAHDIWNTLAIKGEVNSQYNLSILYQHGLGIKKNYKEAFKWSKLAALQKHDNAQSNLGYLYDKGYGVDQSSIKAYQWYKTAALQNLARAQSNLAALLINKEIYKENNKKEAIKWLKKASNNQFNYASSLLKKLEKKMVREKFNEYMQYAINGSAHSQYMLGRAYLNGDYVKKDYKKAHDWFMKSANNNDMDAQRMLWYIYFYGLGVNKDYKKAAGWLKKSALQGDVISIRNMGGIHECGHGVEKNHIELIKWYKQAIEKNDIVSMRLLATIYATSTDNRVRNGTNAVKIAKKALEINVEEEPQYLETLAISYAEIGEFDKARNLIKRALELLKPETEEYRKQKKKLEFFINNKAWRLQCKDLTITNQILKDIH